MNKVFISYGHADASLARKLEHGLSIAGVTSILTQDDVMSGAQLRDSIAKAIRQADYVLLLISPDSIHSPMVSFELGAAETLGKRILPIVVGPVDFKGDLPAWIRDYEVLDARTLPIESVAAQVANAVGGE